MPLATSCESYKGKLLFVLPTIGSGWSQRFPSTPRFQPGDSIAPPLPFSARFSEFHRFRGAVRAGVGIIEQQSHPLDKEWIACLVRDGMGALTYNFSTNPADYNIGIGKTKPIIAIDEENLAMPEWMQFQGSPHLSGVGYIVESPTSLGEIYQRIQRARLPA